MTGYSNSPERALIEAYIQQHGSQGCVCGEEELAALFRLVPDLTNLILPEHRAGFIASLCERLKDMSPDQWNADAIVNALHQLQMKTPDISFHAQASSSKPMLFMQTTPNREGHLFPGQLEEPSLQSILGDQTEGDNQMTMNRLLMPSTPYPRAVNFTQSLHSVTSDLHVSQAMTESELDTPETRHPFQNSQGEDSFKTKAFEEDRRQSETYKELEEAKAMELNALESRYEETLAYYKSNVHTLEGQVEQKQKQLAEFEDYLAQAKDIIADRNAEIEELKEENRILLEESKCNNDLVSEMNSKYQAADLELQNLRKRLACAEMEHEGNMKTICAQKHSMSTMESRYRECFEENQVLKLRLQEADAEVNRLRVVEDELNNLNALTTVSEQEGSAAKKDPAIHVDCAKQVKEVSHQVHSASDSVFLQLKEALNKAELKISKVLQEKEASNKTISKLKFDLDRFSKQFSNEALLESQKSPLYLRSTNVRPLAGDMSPIPRAREDIEHQSFVTIEDAPEVVDELPYTSIVQHQVVMESENRLSKNDGSEEKVNDLFDRLGKSVHRFERDVREMVQDQSLPQFDSDKLECIRDLSDWLTKLKNDVLQVLQSNIRELKEVHAQKSKLKLKIQKIRNDYDVLLHSKSSTESENKRFLDELQVIQMDVQRLEKDKADRDDKIRRLRQELDAAMNARAELEAQSELLKQTTQEPIRSVASIHVQTDESPSSSFISQPATPTTTVKFMEIIGKRNHEFTLQTAKIDQLSHDVQSLRSENAILRQHMKSPQKRLALKALQDSTNTSESRPRKPEAHSREVQTLLADHSTTSIQTDPQTETRVKQKRSWRRTSMTLYTSILLILGAFAGIMFVTTLIRDGIVQVAPHEYHEYGKSLTSSDESFSLSWDAYDLGGSKESSFWNQALVDIVNWFTPSFQDAMTYYRHNYSGFLKYIPDNVPT